MVTKHKQIRYSYEGDTAFNSDNTNFNTLVSGALFNASTRITKLKIAAIPGFGFYINDTPWPARVLLNGSMNDGNTAMFEYEFPDNILAIQPIYSIKCEAESVKRLSDYNQAYPRDAHYLLIDYWEEVND